MQAVIDYLKLVGFTDEEVNEITKRKVFSALLEQQAAYESVLSGNNNSMLNEVMSTSINK